MRFAISTHLYHDVPLNREHLAEIAAHGFEAIELFATRSHFDYHDAGTIASLAGWLHDTGLELHGIHAPVTESFHAGRWGPAFSTAAGDPARREAAVREAGQALEIARRIRTRVLVVHLGVPAGQTQEPGDNQPDAALRSVEEIHDRAAALGVRVALEIIPNELSTAAALVDVLEEQLDLPGVGICLDFGHAFLMGDLVDAVETVSGHLVTTHVHDNHRRTDDHLVPFDGAIDWPPALMAVQKIGYDGAHVLEVGNVSTPADVLEKARRARARLAGMMNA